MDLGLANTAADVVGGGRGWTSSARQRARPVSKNLSLLLAKDEILVNVVSPGSIASESLVGPGARGHFGHPAHLNRAELPHEMGLVVAFLASRRTSYMT
jgi:3-oxoacyl-[acyl-carrier protein] reductase